MTQRSDVAAAIGSAIRDRRKALRMSQVTLASRVGVHPSAVSNWETGKDLPDDARRPAIAKALGFTSTASLFVYRETA